MKEYTNVIMHDDENDSSMNEANGFSLASLAQVIKEYRTAIRLTMLAIAVAFVIGSIAAYVYLPAERTSSLSVRLTFRGAEAGEYPNKSRFASTEVISPTVLSKVYEQNGLARFLSFDEFKSAIYIVQRNDALEALTAEYRAKLSDPKLTPVDRARIEQEYFEKKKSISKADLSLVLVSSERLRKLPIATRDKILHDVLSTWAEQTVSDKGVLLYDISIVSSQVFNEIPKNGDYLVAADLLRTKVDQVQRNIDQLLEIPGIKVLRTKTTKRSLGELRTSLEDVRTYRIQPLIGTLVRNGITTDPIQSTEFLRSAVTFSDLNVQEAQARLAAIRDSLQRYSERQQSRTTSDLPASTPSTPIMDASFLDRILALSAEDTDMKFRQELIDDYRAEALKIVPLEAEVRYYKDLQSAFQSRRLPTDAEKAKLDGELQSIIETSRRMTNEVNEIYDALSADLNPSTALYEVNAPVRHWTERPVSVSTYFLVGVLLLFAAFPAVVLACVLHARFAGNASETENETAVARPGKAVRAKAAEESAG